MMALWEANSHIDPQHALGRLDALAVTFPTALIIVPASPRYSAGLKMLCFRGLCRFVAGRDGSFM